MKKILSLFIGMLCTLSVWSQTPTTDNSTPDVSAQWTSFTQQFQQGKHQQAIEEGVKVSLSLTQNRQYREAFATCRQLDALIYNLEQTSKKPQHDLHFLVTQERLRMYTRLKNSEQCQKQLEYLHNFADQSKSADLREKLLFIEADYYQTTGQSAKSLQCYKQLFQLRAAGKDVAGTDQCYQDMLTHAKESKNTALANAMQKLYTQWQDSIQAVKAAQELKALQLQYNQSQQTLQEKEDRISQDLYFIIALCILSAALTGGLLFLGTLLMKHIRQVKKLKQSLQIANENNEQKSQFIGQISAQITPSLEAIETAAHTSAASLSISIGYLRQLMDDTQTYTTLEATREEHYPQKELNVSALCENIMEKAKADFHSGVEAVVNAPRVSIHTNAEQLERVLLHLLKNAAEHTQSGKITLELKKRSAHTFQFLVTDTGSGIPTEERATLFKPFAQVRDLSQGNCLGLPTCSLIAYKLNGTLSLDPEYKKGARFVLELHV